MGLLSFLIDGIFPPLCAHCGKLGTFLCPKCYNKLEFSQKVHFIADGIPVQSSTNYSDVSAAIVHTLKYDSVKPLAKICAEIIYFSCDISDCDLITSVPLHPVRQRLRGFNQAEEIALQLAKLLQKPYIPLLKRTKHTINFAKVTDKEERKKLSDGLYTLNPKYQNLKYNSALIIDDVWTTGATLKSCSINIKNPYLLTFTHRK